MLHYQRATPLGTEKPGMALLYEHTQLGCTQSGTSIEDNPIGQSVSASRPSRSDDVKIVQQLLNTVPAALGGPVVPLVVDGICGPKTHTAIVRYQNATLGWSDGRVDPNGKTLHHLVDFALNSPTVPYGPLVPAQSAAGVTPPSTVTNGTVEVLYAHAIMRVLAPSIHLLRWRLTHASKNMMAFLGKHFSTGKDKVRVSDIDHLQKVLADIDLYIARCNAFGKLPMENVILYDPEPSPDFVARTTRGGNKMSTKQVQIYQDKKGKITKSPGQSIWLSKLWADGVTYKKHLDLLHEFSHFVGDRDGSPTVIDDYAQHNDPKFLTISRFHKLHSADNIALFILEFCVGTSEIFTIYSLLPNWSHFMQFPRVKNNELIMS